MLDEECLRPGTVSDETFLNKLNTIKSIVNHPHYESRGKLKSDKTIDHNSFRLQHYAGAVSIQTIAYQQWVDSVLSPCEWENPVVNGLMMMTSWWGWGWWKEYKWLKYHYWGSYSKNSGIWLHLIILVKEFWLSKQIELAQGKICYDWCLHIHSQLGTDIN